MPPNYVKLGYVKRQKNDTADAEATPTPLPETEPGSHVGGRLVRLPTN